MLEEIDNQFKEQGQEQARNASPSSGRTMPPPPAPQEETEEDLQAILRWIDEGNPNCQGL